MPCSWLLERWCQHRVPMATPCWIWQHLKRSILMRINLSRFIHRILNQEQIKKLFLSQLSESLVERTATLLQQFNLCTLRVKVYMKSILFEKWKEVEQYFMWHCLECYTRWTKGGSFFKTVRTQRLLKWKLLSSIVFFSLVLFLWQKDRKSVV